VSLTERAALLVLLRDGSRPWRQYADLVEDAGSAVAVLEEELAAAREETLFPPPASAPKDSLKQAEQQIQAWRQNGLELLTILDTNYPENLRTVHDRPPFVFVAGRLTAADARSVAVIGSRSPSAQGVRSASATAAHLMTSGYTIVSGLAKGIDTAAHTAALERGGRTIAVIGTGLNRSYPPENAALQSRIASTCAVVSQFWPDAPPTRQSFPMRNAVMSGIALATVVIEASPTSGARLQARLALAHGRPVLLSDALLTQPWARELAGRPGTHVVRSPSEVTDVVERLTSAETLTA
jgi:DNA processing protein